MVRVGAGAHLSHNLRALVDIVRLVQAVAQVLHAADPVEDVVLGVDSASQVTWVGCDALRACVLRVFLLANCAAWTLIITLVLSRGTII